MNHPTVREARECAEKLTEAQTEPTWGSTFQYHRDLLLRLCQLCDDLYACIEEIVEDGTLVNLPAKRVT
jgi:hypothetical protein